MSNSSPERNRKYYKGHREQIIANNVRWRAGNREKVNAAANSRYKRLRKAVLDLFGRKCRECGFDDIRALQIDHVQNDGALERKVFGRGGSRTFLRKVLKDTDGRYQLLCANCNAIKQLQVRR